MDAQILESEAEFLALEPSWNTLAGASAAGPFQAFGWAAAWLSTIGAARGYRPLVVTLRDGPELRALMPLALRRYKGVRVLEWMGAKVSDYCDVLIDPRIDRGMAARALWEALSRRGDFDILRLGQVRTDAAANELLRGVPAWTEAIEDAWRIPLRWTSGEDWLRDQSANRRADVRRRLRRMARMGFEFRIWRQPEPREPWVEAVIEKKLAWVEARGLQSPLLSADVRDFVRAAAAHLAAHGGLHLSAVRSRDQIAACHLGFFHDGVLYQYIPAYDPALASHGFGTALIDSLAMWACDHGAHCFDMLLGTHEYKSHYHPTRERVYTRVVSRGLLGKAVVSLYRLSTARRRQTGAGEPGEPRSAPTRAAAASAADAARG